MQFIQIRSDFFAIITEKQPQTAVGWKMGLYILFNQPCVLGRIAIR